MKERIHSIDIVRGLIMIIMTLDHVRDFLHLPGPAPLDMKSTTVILFFTRWVTHFCAPTFVFLGGVSACLAGQRRTKSELSSFLLKRGLWLILSDILIISLIFSFNPRYDILVLEVLWATGFGMIILAGLLRAPIAVIGTLGLIIIFGHNLLDQVTIPNTSAAGYFANMMLTAKPLIIPLGGKRMIFEIYAVIPWTGPLLLGYAFGSLFKTGFDAAKRRRILLLSGLALTALFVVVRFINLYGDPAPWSPQRNAAHTLLSFLNTSKQTPSMLYICMTLGPVLVLVSFAENKNNRLTQIFRVYGNVPYLYFIIHMAFVRLLNVILIILMGIPMKSSGFPLVWQADGFGIPLWAVYLFWLFTISALYFPAKWFGNYKRTHPQWWLSYL